jgi:hypothetical protein
MPTSRQGPPTPTGADYTQLDDSALIAARREVREQLDREPPNMADLVRTHYLLTTEVVRRTVACAGSRADEDQP